MKTQNGILESSERNVSALPGTNPVGVSQVPVLHSDREHSKISPSKLKQLEICPGFLADDTREVHAITLQGTKCHEALDSGNDSALTEEERGWVRMCRDYVADLETEVSEPQREIRLDILDGIWGFADLVILHRVLKGGAIDLVDYKFGFSAQDDAGTNAAAQAYVLGLFQMFNWCETIHVHYLYPRREEISRHTYTRKDVSQIRLRIDTIVARVHAGDTFTPIPDNCQYCGRKATCSALHKMVLPLATRYANNHDISVANADFSLVKSPEQWAALMSYTGVLEQMADSIKRHALEFREQSGVEIPGYEMRSRQGKKKIVNADVAYKVANEFGVTHEQFMACVEVSTKQLTDAVKENAARGDKAKVAGALEGSLRDAGVLEMGGESFYLGRTRV